VIVQERWPTSTTEDFAIEVGRETHRGQRVVLTVSDTEIRQEIRYQSLRQVDPDTYSLGEADFMRAIAKEILWRLIAQSKPGAARRWAKMEPPPRARPRRSKK
jgi:hypothetical protein